jgi:anti-sigma B factor antagonist
MDIAIEKQIGSVITVRLTGRLDLMSAGALKQRLNEVVADGGVRLVIDLVDVSFIDSSGLGALIGGLKAARLAGGDLRIARANEQARVVFELTRLDRVLPLYASVEEALADY